MKQSLREFAYITVTILACLITYFMFLGFAGLNSSIDINFHDTYFIFQSLQLIFIYLIFFTFIVYLIRVITIKFSSIVSNCIFMLSNILVISSLVFGLMFSYQLAGRTLYPPLSAVPVEINSSSGLGSSWYIMLCLCIALILLEVWVLKLTIKKARNH